MVTAQEGPRPEARSARPPVPGGAGPQAVRTADNNMKNARRMTSLPSVFDRVRNYLLTVPRHSDNEMNSARVHFGEIIGLALDFPVEPSEHGFSDDDLNVRVLMVTESDIERFDHPILIVFATEIGLPAFGNDVKRGAESEHHVFVFCSMFHGIFADEFE
jgi:hypothetical protein